MPYLLCHEFSEVGEPAIVGSVNAPALADESCESFGV